MGNFILGIVAGLNLYGIYQDLLGQERYIEWCQNNWRPASETLPTHIGVVFICLVLIIWRSFL